MISHGALKGPYTRLMLCLQNCRETKTLSCAPRWQCRSLEGHCQEQLLQNLFSLLFQRGGDWPPFLTPSVRYYYAVSLSHVTSLSIKTLQKTTHLWTEQILANFLYSLIQYCPSRRVLYYVVCTGLHRLLLYKLSFLFQRGFIFSPMVLYTSYQIVRIYYTTKGKAIKGQP